MWRSALAMALLCAASGAADRYHPAARRQPAHQPARAARSELQPAHWVEDARAAIESRRRAGDAGAGGAAGARNVVLFMGDGMSVPTLAAARALLGQRQNRTGEESQLSFENFPTVGLTKTYCVNAQTADSACSATAYLCGVKANQGTIGVSAAVPRGDCVGSAAAAARVESVAAWALADGRDAGFVTTTRVTHASPAGTFAHVPERNWENDADVRGAGLDPTQCPDIAHQLVHAHPGNKFKVILGGGRRNFLPTTVVDEEGSAGRRTDDRNLIREWEAQRVAQNATYQYVWNRQQLRGANDTLPEYLLGLFEANHMQYHMQAPPETEPTLAELTEVAIRMLSRNERGFFLFVEGGRIDHGHHDNMVELALDETLELSSAVARAAELLPEEDSLLVVTADHAHVMAFNGYSPRGSDVLGPSADRDADGVPYMTLSYTNGPGHRREAAGRRVDVTQDEDYRQLTWRTHVDVPLASETHGADDVAVFARGPHHALFSGLFEQSHVPHRLAYAGCFGDGPRACSAGRAPRPLLALGGLTVLVYFATP